MKLYFQLALFLLYRPMKKGNFKLFVYISNLKTHPIILVRPG
jgi:hypothetical protein